MKKEDSEELTEATLSAASMMNLPELAQMVQNAKKEEEYLNPSIGTWLNDRNGLVAKRLFLNSSLFSDITFKLDGVSVYAHRAILTSRCEFMSVMLNSDFLEGKSSEVHTFLCIRMCVYAHVQLCLCMCMVEPIKGFCTFKMYDCSKVIISTAHTYVNIILYNYDYKARISVT